MKGTPDDVSINNDSLVHDVSVNAMTHLVMTSTVTHLSMTSASVGMVRYRTHCA